MELAIPLIALGGMYIVSNQNKEGFNKQSVNKQTANKNDTIDICLVDMQFFYFIILK